MKKNFSKNIFLVAFVFGGCFALTNISSAGLTVTDFSICLTASPTSIETPGTPVILSWTTTDTTGVAVTNSASTCSASGSWSGGKAVSGSEVVYPSATSTYNLTCSDNVIPSSGTASVTVSICTPSYSNKSCGVTHSLNCSLQDNCGKTDTQTAVCTGVNSCTGATSVLSPSTACGATCVSAASTCPACPTLNTGQWKEVTPKF